MKWEHQEVRLGMNVRNVFQGSDRNRQRAAARMYLGSFAARMVAASEATRKKNRRSHLSTEEIAKSMNVWRPCEEPVFLDVIFKEMPSTFGNAAHVEMRARVILSFGVENSARQILVRNILKWMDGISPSQTLVRGGRSRAVNMVKEYWAEGFQHVMEVDIYRCFQSFDRRGIASYLCLPEKVSDYVLGAAHLNLRPSDKCKKDVLYHSPESSVSAMEQFMFRFGGEWDPARLGLTEGSKASPFVAERLLAQVCQDLSASEAGRVVNYADNFVLMARSTSELRSLYNRLWEGLHTHPAGPLAVKECLKKYRPGEEFRFLGYRFNSEGGSLVPTWNQDAEKKAAGLRRAAHRIVNSNAPRLMKDKVLAETKSKHRALVSGYPDWREGGLFHCQKMAALDISSESDRLRRGQ